MNVTSQSLVTSILEILCLKAGLYIISAEGTSFVSDGTATAICVRLCWL